MPFDLSQFINAAIVKSAALVPLVMALTTFAGKLGLAGKAQLAFSMGAGVLFGAAAMLAETGLPAGFSGWFALVIYGLVVGLTTSGVYDTGKAIAYKAVGATMGPSSLGRG